MVAVFRADASTKIGIGHIVRSLCLADGLKKRGIDSVYICKDYQGNLIGKIKQKGFDVVVLNQEADLKEDIDVTAQTIKEHKADFLVTDSYHIIGDYQREIREKVKLLVCIDDLAHTHFYANVLVNLNIGVSERDYQDKVEPYTHTLLGTRYALLRDEFVQRRSNSKQVHPNTNNILVTLGGGDPYNQTLKIIKVLNSIKSLPVSVKSIIGPGYQHTSELKEFVENNCKHVEIIQNCQDIAEIMCWADLAISGGGGTCLELACLGVPNIIIVLVDNQIGVAKEFDKRGQSINLGWFEEVKECDIKKNVLELLNNLPKRKQMGQKGKELVDGLGVERVINEIYSLLKSR